MSKARRACMVIAETLDAYVDGELAEVAQVSENDVIGHLINCPVCLDHVLTVRQLKHAMRQSRVSAAPAEVRARVVSRVYESSHATWRSWAVDPGLVEE